MFKIGSVVYKVTDTTGMPYAIIRLTKGVLIQNPDFPDSFLVLVKDTKGLFSVQQLRDHWKTDKDEAVKWWKQMLFNGYKIEVINE